MHRRVPVAAAVLMAAALPLSFTIPAHAAPVPPSPAFAIGQGSTAQTAKAPEFTEVRDVAALSPNDAWAVGLAYGPGHGGVIQHWDGTSWTTVLDDLPRRLDNEWFNSVAAVSPDDVWAVGGSVDGQNHANHGVVFHWDGSHWRRMASPTFNVGLHTEIFSVTTVAADDVWLAGQDIPEPGGIYQPLVLHWDGEKFHIVDVPHPAQNPSSFTAISADSASDIWAGGTINTFEGKLWAFAEHWDGHAWHRVTGNRSPWRQGAATGPAGVSDIAAVGPGKAWLLGYSNNHTILAHYSGGKWTQARLPGPPSYYPSDISGTSDSDVWIAGADVPVDGAITTLTLHWDGTKWTRVDSPNPPPENATHILFSVYDGGPGRTWAIGAFEKIVHGKFREHPLYLQWDGHRWLSR